MHGFSTSDSTHTGNPLLGTPLMQAQQSTGIDLPLTMLAYEDANGDVFLIYNDVFVTLQVLQQTHRPQTMHD